MRKVMIVAVVLITQALFAQEIDVQELFKKIEEKNAALKNLKAQAFVVIDDPAPEININIAGEVTYLKDEFLSFDVLLNIPGAGSAIINYIYLKDKWAHKLTSNIINLKMALATKGQENNKWTEYFSYLAHFTLLDLNLAPSRVFKGKQLQIEKIKEGEKEYVLLRYPTSFVQNWYHWITCYLNIKNLVFEKVEGVGILFPFSTFTIEVEKFHNINNALLPQSVLVKDNGRVVARIIFKSLQANLEKVEQPYWLSDTNLPEITKETPQELREKIEKDPQNTKLILQYLATKFLEVSGLWISSFNDFLNEYRPMHSKLKEIKTDSVLVNDMEFVSLLGRGKLNECKEKLEQTNYNSPHAIYLLGLKLASKKKNPSGLLEKVKQDNIIKEAILAEYKISQIKTLKDLQDVLEGRTFEEKLFLCNRIEPGFVSKGLPMKFILSKKLVEEMEKNSGDDFVKLLLARYFVRKNENKKAYQYYAQLPDKLFNYIQIEILRTSEEQTLVELIKKLSDDERNELLKQFLPVALNRIPDIFSEDGVINAIKKVTDGKKEEVYELVKNSLNYQKISGNLNKFSISMNDLKDVVIEKIKEEKADKTDFEIIVKYIRSKEWQVEDALNILEKACEKFPSNMEFQEALADQYVNSKQYEKAIKLYRGILSRPLSYVPFRFHFTQKFDELDPDWDVLIKFAFAAGKLDDQSAIKEIDRYGEKYPKRILMLAYAATGKHNIAWQKCKEYLMKESKSRPPLILGDEVEVFLNLAKKTNQTLQAYMICEVILDKLKRHEPEDEWEKRFLQDAINILANKKEALGITPQHFIDYIIQQPYEEAEQSAKEKVQTLIKQLDSNKIEEREQSMEELIKLGKKIVPLLKEHLNSPSLEVQVRVRNILYKIGYDELRQQILQENK